MRKPMIIVLALVLAALTGCAGLDVEWQFNAAYQTDELRAKRRQAAEEALDQAKEARKLAATLGAMKP